MQTKLWPETHHHAIRRRAAARQAANREHRKEKGKKKKHSMHSRSVSIAAMLFTSDTVQGAFIQLLGTLHFIAIA